MMCEKNTDQDNCRTNDFAVEEKKCFTYGLSKPLDVVGREDDGLKK